MLLEMVISGARINSSSFGPVPAVALCRDLQDQDQDNPSSRRDLIHVDDRSILGIENHVTPPGASSEMPQPWEIKTMVQK